MDKGTLQGRNYPLLNQSEELFVSQIVTRVGTFSRKIEEGKKKLKSDIQKLNDTSSIVIRRNWVGFIKKSSVEEGFKITYKDLSEGYKVFSEAIVNANDHISTILDFIVMIVKLESDIYGKLDDLKTNDVEVGDFFETLIQKSDIKDEKYTEILKGLWNRTYTLRDRLRMLQDKINARVDDIVENIQARIDSLENEQNRFFIEGKKELLQEFEEKSKEISRCLQENQRKGEELREEMRRNINDAKDELSSSTQKCEQILAQVTAKEQQIVSDYDSKCKCLQDSITKHENRLDEKSNHVSQSLTLIAKNNESEFAKSKNKLLEISAEARKDFSKQLNAQQELFDSLIELQKKTARRTLFYATSIAVVLSTCISVFLCLTL